MRTGRRAGACWRAIARKVLTIRAQRSAAVLILADRIGDLGLELGLGEHRRAPDHDRERIVELVGDARQQRAEGADLVGLMQRLALPGDLLLGPLHLGDVDEDHQREALLAAAERHARGGDHDVAAIQRVQPPLGLLHALAAQHPGQTLLRAGAIGLGDELDVVPPDQRLRPGRAERSGSRPGS